MTKAHLLTKKEKTLIQLLGQLWLYLGRHRRFQLLCIMVVMVASSIAEILSLASVLPFLSVLANPSTIWNLPLVQQWIPRLGIASEQELLLPITVGFALTALFAGLIRLLNLWLNGIFAAAIGSDLSSEAFRRTLYQPYAVHLTRNSSELISTITVDVVRVISLVLNPLLLLLSSGLIAISLVLTMLLINWLIALGAGLVVSSVYVLAIASSRKQLYLMGKRQILLNRQIIQSLQEGLGAIRDVLLDSTQDFYYRSYRNADQQLRRIYADSVFLSTYPRLVLEPVGMALIAFFGYILILQDGVDKALPLLGALALGSQRLLPVIQKVYEGWGQTLNGKSSLEKLLELLSQQYNTYNNDREIKQFSFKHCIRFEDVHFSYATDLPEVLRGIDLEIRHGERIGFIGCTGSGKSTTLDLLMGLLEPTSGRILVDSHDLNNLEHPENLLSWRATIAHVPQNIYLSDSSFAENIAFGIPKKDIDMSKVRKAAQQSQIAAFIETSPMGYDSFVGEHGIRLSGGQRQRVGIARALYKQAQVIVFDEATSSLDTNTESAVMEAIDNLSSNLTIIIIAHRLSTISQCSRIVHLDQGKILRIVQPENI